MEFFAHCGMLTLEPESLSESVAKVEKGLLDLVGVIPGLVKATVGATAEVRPDAASLLFIMEFDSEASWAAYGGHPAHQAVVADAIAPVLVEKKFFQTRNFHSRSAQ